MNTPYNKQYRPPFPALQVYIRSGDITSGPYEALLDTGADITFVPVDLLNKVEALEAISGRVRSHFGESHPVQLFVLAFQVGDITLASTYVVADEQGNDIILGRDVLNKLPLFLDGVQMQTDVLDDISVQRLRNRR